MRHALHTFSFLALIFCSGCSTSKSVVKVPKPTYNITYKLIANADFTHLDASYLDKTNVGIHQKDIGGKQIEIPIGLVAEGFVASISSTGYGAKDSLASIELQIYSNGALVSKGMAHGINPSLAVSYLVE